MKASLAFILTVVFIFTSCQRPNQQLTNTEKAEIEKEISSLTSVIFRTTAQPELDNKTNILKEDGLYAVNGKILTLAQYYTQMKEAYDQIEVRTMSMEPPIQFYSPNLALQIIHAKIDNRPYKHFVWTVVWVKSDGEWRIQHIHQSWSPVEKKIQ